MRTWRKWRREWRRKKESNYKDISSRSSSSSSSSSIWIEVSASPVYQLFEICIFLLAFLYLLTLPRPALRPNSQHNFWIVICLYLIMSVWVWLLLLLAQLSSWCKKRLVSCTNSSPLFFMSLPLSLSLSLSLSLTNSYFATCIQTT